MSTTVVSAPNSPVGSKYNSRQAFNGCYDFDESFFKRLVNSVKNSTDSEVKCSISLSNSINIESSDVDEIFQDTSLGVHPIEKMEITSGGGRDNGITFVYVKMEPTQFGGCVNVSISGQKNSVISLRNEIEEMIYVCRKWYSFLNYKNNFFFFVSEIILAGAASFFVPYYILTNTPPWVFGNNQNIAYSVFGLSIAAFFFSIASFRNYAFPLLVFRIGAGKKKRDFQEKFAKFIFVTVIFGIFLKILSSFVEHSIFPKKPT